jgi:hypothetical protein
MSTSLFRTISFIRHMETRILYFCGPKPGTRPVHLPQHYVAGPLAPVSKLPTPMMTAPATSTIIKTAARMDKGGGKLIKTGYAHAGKG